MYLMIQIAFDFLLEQLYKAAIARSQTSNKIKMKLVIVTKM
jgi:hypothetical protein